MKKIIQLPSLLSLFIMVNAQSSIVGRVVDQHENEPIASVNVYLVNYDLGASTDSEGYFRIDLPEDFSEPTIELTAIGFTSLNKKIEIDDLKSGILFKMESKAIEMDPIYVIKNLSRITNPFLRSPGSVDKITSLDIKKFNDTDVNRMLGKIPGIYIQEEDGFGLRPNIGMRGTGVERSSKINMMEDGVPISPAPYSSPAAYYSPTAGRMHALEARKGSSQIKYGPHSTGGALNYVSTPIPEKFESNFNLNTGNYESIMLNANVGSSNPNYGYLFEILHDENNGFKNIDYSNNGTGFNKTDLMGKLRYNSKLFKHYPSAIELKVSSASEISNETYLGLTQKDYEKNPYARYTASQKDQMNADHSQVSLTGSLQISKNMNFSLIGYRNDFRRNWYKLSKVNGKSIGSLMNDGNESSNYKFLSTFEAPDNTYDIKANNREYYSKGIQLIANIKLYFLADHDILMGLRAHEDEMNRFQKVDKYGMNKGKLKMSTSGTWGIGSKNNRLDNAIAQSIFIEDQFKIRDFVVTAGVRYEKIALNRNDWNGDISGSNKSWNDPKRELSPTQKKKKIDILIPGLGVNYNLNSKIELLAGIHKGFSPPGPGSNESEEIKPEESINLETGISYTNNSDKFKAIYFNSAYSNLLGDDTQFAGDGTYDQFNAGKVNIYGLELSISRLSKYNKLFIPINLSYTYTKSEFLTSFESSFEAWGSVKSGYELPYLPSNLIYGEIGMIGTKASAYFRMKKISKMKTVAGTGVFDIENVTDDLNQLDLLGQYKINNNSNLFISIKNLTNSKSVVSRRPAGLRPTMPKTITLGLRLNI